MDLAEPAYLKRFPSVEGLDFRAPLFQRGRAALRLLNDGYLYAGQLDRSVWDFAEEIASLRKGGLTNGDLRWLVCNGLVEHGCDITQDGEMKRKFEHTVGLHFAQKTCFVLTDVGAWHVREYLSRPSLNGEARASKPTWNRDLQELRLGKMIVKQFKVPAPNQETILAVFQEEDWPVYIDDPLPTHPDIDPKRRLHDTINSLNRNQRNALIQFRGNGSGDGVRWELIKSGDGTT